MKKLGQFLVVIPPLTYWVFWTLNPSYWFNADPAAVYFVDSLSVFAGYSYKFVDHPGTPVHLIGSFLLALTYPFFSSQEAFINFHLGRPGVFFLMTNTFLLAANMICVLVFYKTVCNTIKYDRVIAGIALALLYFLLHPYSFPSLTFWSHNSFNYPFGTLWLLWLFNELRRNEEIGWKKLILMGFAADILAVAQTYFIVWLVSGIFTIFVFILRLGKTIRQATLSSTYMLIGGIFGILTMLVPVYRELPRFAGWLTRIITHQGLYGTGESGIYTLAMIPISISYWWATIRPMMLILLSTLIALGWLIAWMRRSHNKIPPGIFAMILGILFQTGLVLFVMSKAVLRLRFSLSLAALLPVIILLVLKLSETAPWGGSKLKRLLYAAVIIGVISTLEQIVSKMMG
ncbi:MAG: hypothetical protein ABIU06_06150 [Anaerolineales bacterium]